MTTGKTIALTRRTFVGKVMSLLFNMLSRWVITFLLNLYAEYMLRNTGKEETQAGIKIAGRNSITSDMQMTPALWQKSKRN